MLNELKIYGYIRNQRNEKMNNFINTNMPKKTKMLEATYTKFRTNLQNLIQTPTVLIVPKRMSQSLWLKMLMVVVIKWKMKIRMIESKSSNLP